MTLPNAAEIRRDALRGQLESLRDLPTPSRVVHEIWRVLDDPRASASSLAAVLGRDPALAARTLRLANSAYFGLPNPVADVRAACVVLGFETVRGLAVGVAALDLLTRPAGGILDLDAFWMHSVATATAARAIARKIGLPDTGTAFCGGILHDIGRLALAVLAPVEYRAMLRETGSGSERSREIEALGAAHDEVGGWLAERWRFPPALWEAIARHHPPESEDPWPRWGALVHVADTIAHRHAHPCQPVPRAPEGAPGEKHPSAAATSVPVPAIEPASAALRLLGISAASLAAVEESFTGELERIGSLAAAAGGRS